MANIRLVERWARPLFRKFGLSEEDVRVEFGGEEFGRRERLFGTEELERRYEAAREYEREKERMRARVSQVRVKRRFFGQRR